jgi:hypothetical protein
MWPTAGQDHALIPLKYSRLKNLEKLFQFGVGLSSNTWHASVNMVVGENFKGQQAVSLILFVVIMVFESLMPPNDVHNVLL